MNSLRGLLKALVRFEIFITAGLTAISVVSERLLPSAVIVFLVFWFLRWLTEGRLTRRTVLDWPILGLICMLPVTIWATALPEVTIPQVLRLLTGIGLFYSLVNWATDTMHLRIVLVGISAALIGLAAVGTFFVEWDPGKLPIIPDKIYQYLPSLPGEVIQRTVMGGYLMLLIPVCIAWLLFSIARLRKLEVAASLFSILIGAAVLVLTIARGAYIGLAVAVAILGLLRWPKSWWVLGGLALCVVGGVVWLGPDRVVNAFNDNSAFAGISGRLEIYSRALLMIRDFPFTGIGMGTFGPVMDTLYPLVSINPGVIPHAHNLILQVAVDLGIPGLLCWLAAWILVVRRAWQVYRGGLKIDNLWLAGIGAGVIASQAAMMTQGMMDAVMWGMVRPAPMVWLVWGLAEASWQIISSELNKV